MTVADTIAWAKPEDVGLSRERLARLPDAIAADIAAGRYPGAVTLVARHGKVVHFKAQGRRDPAGDAPMERDSIFRIYSMTKPIVTVAAMMLVEEGRLFLSDPVSRFVPEFADLRVWDGDGPGRPPETPPNVHDLLRHTSGLTYDDWIGDHPVQKLYTTAAIRARDRTNAEQAALIATLPLLCEPGAAWHYSRSTDILGRVIEVVAGRSLGEELRLRILEPLGMLETAFHVPHAFQGRMAEAFPTDPQTGEPIRLFDVTRPTALENGGGGLASTAPDYARFLHMLASGGALDGVRLLSPATIRWMTADHLGPIPIGPGIMPPGYTFGLGFAVRREAGLAAMAGSAGDYYWEGLAGTSFWVDPANELYGLAMIQAPGERERVRMLMRQLVYGAIVGQQSGCKSESRPTLC